MAEYIDRGPAIAKLTALDVIEPNATIADAKRLLADMPAADVALVVRCKDCKYLRFYGSGNIYCVHSEGLSSQELDAFCSYGERKGYDNAT